MKSQSEPKKKAGRHRRNIDLDAVRMLAKVHCTVNEIAATLNIPRKTLESRPDVMAVIEEARAEGKASIRKAQWDMALGGNATMLIWIGKQELGQRDKAEQEITTHGEKTIIVLPDNGRGGKGQASGASAGPSDPVPVDSG